MSESQLTNAFDQTRFSERAVRQYLLEKLPGVLIIGITVIGHKDTNGFWEVLLRASTGNSGRYLFVVDGDPLANHHIQAFKREDVLELTTRSVMWLPKTT